VETASTYFTRRARQERAKAADANSAEARKAHLELAFRLVTVATERPLWTEWPENLPEGTAAHQQTALASSDVGNALSAAIPLPATGPFEDLLDAVEKCASSVTFVL
jgi:hypothetical protein